ncbi:MAG TPA: hypothetical protein PLH22_01040 [Candidatus Colwellbacteria bacterium]|nr:hypothetical protein [Candidatus Colwellbacteria bacterium]
MKKAMAQQAVVPSEPNATVPDPNAIVPTGLPTDIGALITRIWSLVLWIASAIMIYQAFRAAWDLMTNKNIVTAQANAKNRLWNAIIGLVVILFAQSIPGIVREFFAG